MAPIPLRARPGPTSTGAKYMTSGDTSARVPQRSVCFLKTHRCASTCVQNVLLRYGESHGLRFVLPESDTNLDHPLPFNRSVAPGKPPFDVLAHNARFNEPEIRAVLGPEAVYVTIVREPASLFDSLYSYYGLEVRSPNSTSDIRGLFSGSRKI
ncbi:hypothetical protein HPB48_020682 [Haemaphysalis longicornis]|uniref:Galactose-3-O-sulfotransferase n=1 Tax=Haemaphysalis longicornis TaxID=44386 RepID=A0A9J6G4C2_HAELO|nr:hypothetical protein HPB48_020682 [Haemaphysalis longicornis]